MTTLQNDVLLRLLGSLQDSASQIDQTFSTAGEQLGQGLSVFESLKDGLGALSQELAGADLGAACDALRALAGDLDALSDNLPTETATLAAIASEGSAASGSLERLLGSMRLVGILARGARIEAASVEKGGQDFADFADEIVSLARRAQETVEACMRDHDGLSALLGSALRIQRDFETRYRTTLSQLAGQLRTTLATVDERQRQGVALTRDAAILSGKIATAAGGAIMALQSGDAIRQRLEHALLALSLAQDHSGSAPHASLSSCGRQALETALSHLQERQLDATAKALRHGVLDIDQALLLLEGDTAPLIDLGRSLYGGDVSSSSFLQLLEADLAKAADLLDKCRVARRGVEQVTGALTRSLDTLDGTVASLDDTVANILLIGTNASLRAARLGQSGRSLIVIAQEMKSAAAVIARDAAKLNPVFAAMQQAARALERRDGEGASVETLGASMDISLDAIRASGQRLGDTLARLSREGIAFAAVIGQARLMFQNAAATADVIQSGAAILAPAGNRLPEITQDERGAILALFQSTIRPAYTMVAERQIHDAALATLKLSGPGGDAKVVAMDRQEAALDDLLF